MAESQDQFRQSDVTFWGIVVLALGGFALLCASLSALLPASVMTGLHSTRLEGGNLNHLRMQVADLRGEAERIRSENNRLKTMLTLAEQNQSDVTRRVGAIESTLPGLLDANGGMKVDGSIVTSAIDGDEPADATIRQVDGGSVAVRQTPLGGGDDSTAATASKGEPQPMPGVLKTPEPRPDRNLSSPPSAYGLALGPKVTVQNAFLAWKDITNKVGPLLLGLGPLLSGNAGTDQQRLVAGPIDDYAEAERLCAHMIRVGISCLPVPFAGEALPE